MGLGVKGGGREKSLDFGRGRQGYGPTLAH